VNLRRPKVLAGIACIALVGVSLLSFVSISGAYQRQQEYDAALKAHGIEPSLQDVEKYLHGAIVPGISKPDLLNRLAPLGIAGHSGVDIPDCEDIRIFLLRRPGDKFPFYVPPNTPPIYDVVVCYRGGLISQIGNLKRVDELGQ
jgi:hypothetical protein